MTNKTYDLGEYVVDIAYNEETGEILVEVSDEEGDIIESIHITNDEDSSPEDKFNLN